MPKQFNSISDTLERKVNETGKKNPVRTMFLLISIPSALSVMVGLTFIIFLKAEPLFAFLGIHFVLLGLFFLIISVLDKATEIKKKSFFLPVDGVVLAYCSRTNEYGDDVFSPVYEFYVGGSRYEHLFCVPGNKAPAVGAKETIFYNPDNPSDCILGAQSRANIRIILAAVLLGIGISVLIASLRWVLYHHYADFWSVLSTFYTG